MVQVADQGYSHILKSFHGAVDGATKLGVTAWCGYSATWCAERAEKAVRGKR